MKITYFLFEGILLPRDEERYYDSVLDWLDDQGYYTGGHIVNDDEFFFKRTGTAGRFPDCCGVKNAGNRFIDDIEVAAVEVKDRRITPKHVQQGLVYSIMAHKVYIAGPQAYTELSEDVLRLLETAGIGYLEGNKKADGTWKITERLSSRRHFPSHAELLRLLHRWGIHQCTICGGYFFTWSTWDGEEFHTMMKIRRPRHIDCQRDDLGEPFDRKSRRGLNRSYLINRYLCRSCIIELPEKIARWTKRHQKEVPE